MGTRVFVRPGFLIHFLYGSSDIANSFIEDDTAFGYEFRSNLLLQGFRQLATACLQIQVVSNWLIMCKDLCCINIWSILRCTSNWTLTGTSGVEEDLMADSTIFKKSLTSLVSINFSAINTVLPIVINSGCDSHLETMSLNFGEDRIILLMDIKS